MFSLDNIMLSTGNDRDVQEWCVYILLSYLSHFFQLFRLVLRLWLVPKFLLKSKKKSNRTRTSRGLHLLMKPMRGSGGKITWLCQNVSDTWSWIKIQSSLRTIWFFWSQTLLSCRATFDKQWCCYLLNWIPVVFLILWLAVLVHSRQPLPFTLNCF